MAQQPPGEGHQPIVDPLYVKKKLAKEETLPEEKKRDEAKKESESTAEDFESFGHPSDLQKMKDNKED